LGDRSRNLTVESCFMGESQGLKWAPVVLASNHSVAVEQLLEHVAGVRSTPRLERTNGDRVGVIERCCSLLELQHVTSAWFENAAIGAAQQQSQGFVQPEPCEPRARRFMDHSNFLDLLKALVITPHADLDQQLGAGIENRSF